MARLELIKELEIRRNEIYSEIRAKFPELIDDLESIDKLLGNKLANIGGDSFSKTDLVPEKQGVGTPKDKVSWMDYVLFMLKEIGGKGKSRDVANAIDKANPDISLQRSVNASQDKLSRLLKEGKIKANKPQYKKEGYTYEIL